MPDHTSPHTLISLGQFGERARPLRAPLREVALVIGLGYVGLQAIARTHDMLSTLLTRRDYQTHLRLLAIARRRTIREESVIPREERLPLEMEPINWTDVPGRYAQFGVAQWWPHSPRAREVQEDPTLVRAYNRLMLFHNAALISDALYKLMQWFHDAEQGRDPHMKRRIYVLASLAEAEGSGLLFDIVARLRDLAGQSATEIVGVFSLRARPQPRDPDHVLAMANVYATLREIDSYTLHPDTFVSTLPVLGHTLNRVRSRPALDMIMLADDATANGDSLPETLLAEGVTNWIASSMTPPHPPVSLPVPIPVRPGTDRFTGYSTFGISKLALPTEAAMNLAAVGVAQAALKAIKTLHANTPAAGWVEPLIAEARRVIIDANILNSADVSERLRDWNYDMSAAGLLRKLDTRTGRGESASMQELLHTEWRRLERESLSERDIDQNTISSLPNDSIRMRVDMVLGINRRELLAQLLHSPVELAFVRGYGLVWTIGALEELARALAAVLPEFERVLGEAVAAQEIARRALVEAAQHYDTRRGGRRANPSELETHASEALTAAAALIVAQGRVHAWEELGGTVQDLIGQVRDVLPQVEAAGQELHDFETACRQAMEFSSQQTPQLPAAVALSESWYANGVQEITSMGQLPPHELLAQVYAAWGNPGDLSPDRQLGRFLGEIRDAARRMLAGVFQFTDLYGFLRTTERGAVYRQVLASLPGAATPALVPAADDKHPPPERYEIVREAPQRVSAIGPPQPGVSRCTLPSPDPDEISVMRVLHGMMAEAITALRENYRRAYDRAGAEGMPLHIDRRWDSTMADLVHTTVRREISVIWESLINALQRNPKAVDQPLDALIRALGVALDVQETNYVPGTTHDMRLILFKLRPFRLKLPPPSCAVLFVYSSRSADELSEEAFQAITPLPLEEQFAFVVNVNNRPDIDTIIEPLRRVDFTILVLNESDIKHLISARLPTRALSDMVLSQVSLTTVSPFFTRGPVPEHMFFGREREIAEVRSKLRTHSVALIGGRRIGKTSTLQRIQRLLKPPDSEYIPYYLDCHGATQYRAFFWLINRRWDVPIDQDADPVEFEDVITRLMERHPGKNIVLLFDEIDSLLMFDRKEENQETLFRSFRSLSNEKRCQYIFSGEKWLMRAIANPYSALFNFAQAVQLRPLPPKVVHHLVADPFEMLNIWIEDSDQVIQRIYEISAGHPNIVQMICQGMIEELDQDPQNANLLNFSHLDKATSHRTLQEQIVQTIWGQMNPMARLITLLWPEGERFLTLGEVEGLLNKVGLRNISPDRLERTSRDLVLYCFVRPRDNDQLELIPMAFPAILDFMTDKQRQIDIVRQEYERNPDGVVP